MSTHLALLRGVNLGSKNKVPMKELRTRLEELGYKDVRTYIQSGNVILESGSATKKVAEGIEKAISDAYGLKISVVMRTRVGLKRVLESNPFLTKRSDLSSLHVMFLADMPSAKALSALDPHRSAPDEFKVKGREVYMLFPNGSGRSKLTLDYFERTLGTRATARNWKTVIKLLEMMDAP